MVFVLVDKRHSGWGEVRWKGKKIWRLEVAK